MTISAAFEGICYMIAVNASHSNIIAEIAKQPKHIADLTAHYKVKKVNNMDCGDCNHCNNLEQPYADYDPNCILGMDRPGCYDCGQCER